MIFYSDVFSSGEREIVHFLLAMFALNVQDGLILVDEPELHLHPRWQRMFLSLFRELAPERNNQFLIATHSPVFVSPETLESIIRVFRADGKGSRRVALRDADLPEDKQLVRMINSQNNERMFFADRVVLVEGQSDRLIVGSLVERALDYFGDNRAVEVIEVGGKNNFAGYQRLLDALKTPWTVVADRDFLEQIGSPEVKRLFEIDNQSQAEALLEDKKSLDRATLVDSIRRHVQGDDRAALSQFLEYLDARHRKLKSNLSLEDRQRLERDYARLSSEGVELLRFGNGEIEDYMPRRLTDIGAIVDLVSDPAWICKIRDAERRVHLGEIICRVLQVSGETHTDFINSLRAGRAVFVRPAQVRNI
jgi:predicted ATP-dependent endonuclease of OLD family